MPDEIIPLTEEDGTPSHLAAHCEKCLSIAS